MGHTRIGRLYRSQVWKEVVALFCIGADYEQIAKVVLDAASAGFNEIRLSQDAGYQKAVDLLVQMGIAAQSGDFIGHMGKCGISLSVTSSTQELMAKLAEAVDDAAWANGSVKTDPGEYAKLALVNAVSYCANKELSQNIPGLTNDPDITIWKSFGSKINFADLNQHFIATVTARGLNAYMAQILPNLTGNVQRVSSIHELNTSYKALAKHCLETASVHRVYSTEWLGKHEYKLKDINARTIQRHANFMVKKMIRALRYGNGD
ncbi:MAG: hypothetical protein WCS24_12730 [Methanoculleus sp.]|jgi:hypothetical protein